MSASTSAVGVDRRALVGTEDQVKNPREHIVLLSAVGVDAHADVEKERDDPSQHLTLRSDRHPGPYPD